MSSAPSPEPEAASLGKVLIIEDDVQICKTLQTFFTAKGYAVVTAGDGLEGIRLFSSERPSVVLLDMLLPRLLGTDVCDMIKRSVEGAHVPVVMMSAVLKPATMEQDFRGKRSPDAVLLKPFQFQELLRVVQSLLEGARGEVEEAGYEILELVDAGDERILPLSRGEAPAPRAAPPPLPEAARPAPATEPTATAPSEAHSAPRIIARAAAPVTAPGGDDLREFDEFLQDVRSAFDEELHAGPPVPPPPTGEAPAAPAAVPPRPEVPPAEPEYSEGAGTIRSRAPGGGPRETTFAELLVLLYRRIYSGILTLERSGGRKEIYFLNGYPVHVVSSYRGENLGRSLVRMGRITEEQYLYCLQYMEEKRRDAAEALLELGLVSAQDLPPLLRTLQRENLIRCFAWDGAFFELRKGAELVGRVPVFEMNPLAIVAEGICTVYPHERLEAELRPMMERFLHPTVDLSRYSSQVAPMLPIEDLDPLLDGRRRFFELCDLHADDRAGLFKTLKVLLVLGMVELSEHAATAAAPALDPAPVWPEMKEGGPRDDAEPVERILKTYLQVKRQNHFELLGVPMAAPPEEIERAYAERAREFHPDRLQVLSSTEVRSKGKEIYVAIGRAYEVLRDPRQRNEYLASLGQEPQAVAGLAASEEEYRKGERFLQQGSWANAQVAFMSALRLNPREPEYYRQLGWAMYQNYRSSGNDAAVSRAVNFLRKAITMSPRDDAAYYFLGRIYQDKGQTQVAHQLYQRALRCNPENAQAQEAARGIKT